MSPPQPPKLPPRPSSIQLPAVDVVAPGAVHTLRPIALPNDTATTARPPPPDRRAPPREYAAHKPSPKAVVVPPLVAPRMPTLRDHEEESTLHGVGPAPQDHEVRDSQEISTDSILAELAKKSAEARASDAARVAAEGRAHEAELKVAAAESGVTAQGPSINLGSAKWWVLVLGALAVGGPFSATQIREWLRPSISAEQLNDLRKQVKGISDGIDKRNTDDAGKETAESKRWTITVAFLCSQGLRARGINCEEAQRYADFQPQPLTGSNKVRGEPQWKATVGWPPVPVPKD